MNKVIPLISSMVMVTVGALLNDFTSAITTARALMIMGGVASFCSICYLIFKG